MLSLKGQVIAQLPVDVLRVALPLGMYVATMFLITLFVAKTGWIGARYGQNTTASLRRRIG